MSREYKYYVITKIPTNIGEDTGNLYHASTFGDEITTEVFLENSRQTNVRGLTYKDVKRISNGSLQLKAFELGEICIVDPKYGREVAGKRRKPNKWFIEYEEFDDIDSAVNRAEEVLEEYDRLLLDKLENSFNE